MQELRYTQTEAGLLPAWRVLSEFSELARMRAEQLGAAKDAADDIFDGWEGIE